MNNILGQYSRDGYAFIDSNNAGDIITIVHERIHLFLTQGTPWGYYSILLKFFSHKCNPQLNFVNDILQNASILTQEMTAIYCQCGYKKLSDNENFEEYLREYKKTDYYRKYCLSGFEELIKRDNGFSILRVAKIAMGIDVTKIEGLDLNKPEEIYNVILSNPIAYWPDYRYIKLFEAIKEEDVNSKSFSAECIAEKIGIEFIFDSQENTWAMFNRMCNQIRYTNVSVNFEEKVAEIRSIIEKSFIKDDKEESDEEYVVPAALNWNLTHPKRFQIEEKDYQMTAVTVVLNDPFNNKIFSALVPNRDVLILDHASLGHRYILLLKRDETIEFLNNFKGEIILGHENLNLFQQVMPNTKKRIFVLFYGLYRNFKRVLDNVEPQIKHVYLHSLKEFIAIIVMTPQGVFITLQLFTVIEEFADDLSRGKYAYVNIFNNNKDGIFYISDDDWRCYENVLLACIGKTVSDSALGGRIPIYTYAKELLELVKEKYCATMDLSNYKGFFVSMSPEAEDSRIKHDDDNGASIILSKSFMDSVNFAENEEKRKKAGQIFSHTIHRMFCHIDISNKIKEIQKGLFTEETIEFTLAFIFFHEFIVSSMSWNTLPKNKRNKIFIEYEACCNGIVLPLGFDEYLELIKNTACILGYANSKEEWYCNIVNKIKNNKVKHVISSIGRCLCELEEKYPVITSEDFESIEQQIFENYNMLATE